MAEVNYEQLFHEVVKDRGGRLNTDSLDERHKNLFDQIKYHAQSMINSYRTDPYASKYGTMPHVHFDFVNNSKINALAASDGEEFIGIYHGAILTLEEIFNRLLANSNTFPGIGIPALEKYNEPLPCVPVDYNVISIHYETYDLPCVTPVDVTRRDFANLLMQSALVFLVEHEIAHLRFGHVQFIRASTGVNFILEYDLEDSLSQTGKKKLDSLTKKTLEWDADCWAASHGIMRFIKVIGETEKDNTKVPIVHIEMEWCKAWFSGVWTLFRLRDIAQINSGLPSTPSYPSPRERIQCILAVFATMLIDVFHVEKSMRDDMIDSVIETVCNTDSAISTISDYVCDTKEILGFLGTHGYEMALYDPCRHHWQTNLKQSLEPFTRAPLIH